MIAVHSLRWRLLLSLLALLALAALLTGGLTYRSVLAQTEALFDYQLRQMALSLRDQGEIAPDQAAALNDEELDVVIQIWTADGRTIYASRPHSALPARALIGWADVEAGPERWRTFSVATRDRVIQVAQPLRIRQHLAANAALRSVLPLAAVAPLLGAALWWLTALTLRPLQQLAVAVRRRDADALSPLPASGLPDEVAPLADALNALLARLARSLDGQRAFVADAAHELRSPLTALKLQLTLLERAPDDAARRAAQAELARGIERSARLVEQLLALARSEPGAPPAPAQRVDLAELAREVMADTVPLALQRGSALDLQATGAVPVEGDAVALRLLLRNLIDNALRHSPPGTPVAVGVERLGDQAVLRVDDAGPGIPPDDRERVFDRFYRRSATPAEGSGLGLAIVRSIAERHGGTVALDRSPQSGLRAELRLPALTFASSAAHEGLTAAS